MLGVVGAPALPPHWDAAAVSPLRLEDPGGTAIAWVAPGHGGNCVGYIVRRGDAWAPVLAGTSARALRQRPTRHGCPVLFPFPGHALGARYAWGGRTYVLPVNAPSGPHHVHGFAHTHAWQVLAQAPASVTLGFSTATDLRPDERAAYPFDVRLTLRVSVAGGALGLELEATNVGDRGAPVGLGLHPYVDPGLLGGRRAGVRACLPGTGERVLRGGVPTGEVRVVGPEAIAAPPEGASALVARTGFVDGAAAWLGVNGAPASVRLTVREGFREMLLFAPAEDATLSLEPLTSPISGASQAEGHPDALPALAPGARLRAAASIAVEDAP